MLHLSPIEALRLKNLRMLHARPDYFGAPTTASLIDYLMAKGLVLKKDTLTQIYQGAKPLDALITTQIETAFELPSGWMSCSHEFVYTLESATNAALALLLSLPKPIQEKFYLLIEAIANDGNPKAR